jgi:hypothetical protein
MLRLVKQRIRRLAHSLIDPVVGTYFDRRNLIQRDIAPAVDRGTQILLGLAYGQIRDRGGPLPSFGDVGYRAFSQNEEDGILHYIFSLIGTKTKRSVEICAGDGIECNTANLIVNHGWIGLLVDGDTQQVTRGKQFYATHPDTLWCPPAFIQAWVTRENVNSLIANTGFRGEIDLLSLDLDGVDYWIWQAIDVIQPRAVVAEYQTLWGAERAATVPYRPDFRKSVEYPDFCGASLPALVKLGREKGYRLIGVNRYCFNAFFVRDSIGEDLLPEIRADECFEHPHAYEWITKRRPLVAHLDWVDI